MTNGPTKKRTHSKKECPYCHNHYGNLQNHIKMKHPTEGDKTPPPGLTKEQLTGEQPAAPPPPGPGEQQYACSECKAELRKLESPCWNCGQEMAWTGIA